MSNYWHQLTRGEFRAAVGQRFVAGGRRYVLAGQIDNGAIGVVRKATDAETQELVAVKFLAPEPKYIDVASFDDIYARFRREGIRGAGLAHDNLVRIMAYEDNCDGAAFDGPGPCNPSIVMEYIRGRTLESLIKSQHHQPPTVENSEKRLHIAWLVSRAILYLHERHIIHRDIKPANIFISNVSGQQKPSLVKLGDFGVVQWGDFMASVTSGYMFRLPTIDTAAVG